jgi:hypothetical protein
MMIRALALPLPIPELDSEAVSFHNRIALHSLDLTDPESSRGPHFRDCVYPRGDRSALLVRRAHHGTRIKYATRLSIKDLGPIREQPAVASVGKADREFWNPSHSLRQVSGRGESNRMRAAMPPDSLRDDPIFRISRATSPAGLRLPTYASRPKCAILPPVQPIGLRPARA